MRVFTIIGLILLFIYFFNAEASQTKSASNDEKTSANITIENPKQASLTSGTSTRIKLDSKSESSPETVLSPSNVQSASE